MADLLPSPNYAAFAQAQGQQNPMQQMGQMIGVQQNMLQLQGAQQEFAARQAMGPISQASIDPTTGQMDYGKFATLLASNPATAWKAPDIINSIVTREQTQAATIKTQLESGIEAQKLVGNGLASLVGLGQNVKRSDVANEIAAIRAQPAGQVIFPTADSVTKFIAGLPQDGAPLAQYVRMGAVRGAAAAGHMENVFGKVNWTNTGGQQIPQTELNGQVTGPAGAPIANTPTPEQMNAIQPGAQDQSGAPVAIPRVQVAPMVNGAGQVATNPVAPGAGPQSAGGAPSSLPQTPQGNSVTGPGIERKAEMEATTSGIKDYQTALQESAQKTVQSEQMLGDIRGQLPNIKTGGGTTFLAQIGQVAQGMGVPQEIVDKYMGSGNLSSVQIAQKLLSQIATANMSQSLAGGGRFTNTEFTTFQKYNPNVDTDPRAMANMLEFMHQVNQQKLEEQTAYQSYKQMNRANPSAYPLADFPAKWDQHLMSMYNSGKITIPGAPKAGGQ